jgi:hypothetical protein
MIGQPYVALFVCPLHRLAGLDVALHQQKVNAAGMILFCESMIGDSDMLGYVSVFRILF